MVVWWWLMFGCAACVFDAVANVFVDVVLGAMPVPGVMLLLVGVLMVVPVVW